MLASGDALETSGIPGYEATRDFVGTDVHGLGTTHLDALCHMFVRGQMYNGGRPADVPSSGATRNSVMTLADGIVGRGVLLDVPGALGRPYLEADHAITPDQLEAAERAQGVTVGSGDILLISTGRDARRTEASGQLNPFVKGLAGLHPDCLRWLSDREVAVLCSDGISDLLPPRPGSLVVPRPSDRDRRHGAAPDRQRPAGHPARGVPSGAPLRVPLHRVTAAHPGRHGKPDQPDRAAVTPLIDSSVQQALGVVARRAKDLSLHEQLGQRVGYPLEGPYYGTLARLGTSGSVTVSELAGLLNLELSTVSRRVRVLEERQLVERTTGADRRTSYLRLTAEGQQMFSALEKGWRLMLSEIVADWDEADVARFSELFTRFAAAFERYATGPRNASKPQLSHA